LARKGRREKGIIKITKQLQKGEGGGGHKRFGELRKSQNQGF